MKAYRLYLIRHGLTEANRQGRYIGVTDLPLSEEGKAELSSLVDTGAYPVVQKVYASPLLRATQTAAILYPDHPVQTVDGLKEYDFGEFENRTIESLSGDRSFEAWVAGNMQTAPVGGESREMFANRIVGGFCEVIQDMMTSQVTSAALIGHAGILSALLSQFGLPRRAPSLWKLRPGEGVCLLTTAQLWARDQIFEVCDPVPFTEESSPAADYRVLDVDDLKKQRDDLKKGE